MNFRLFMNSLEMGMKRGAEKAGIRWRLGLREQAILVWARMIVGDADSWGDRAYSTE